MKAIFFIAQKDLRLLLRDKGEVFFTFFFPVFLFRNKYILFIFKSSN